MTTLLRFLAIPIAAYFCLATGADDPTVALSTPTYGQTAVPLRTLPEISLFDVEDIELELTEGMAVVVAGSMQAKSGRVRFVPDAPLRPDTDYVLWIRHVPGGTLLWDPVLPERTRVAATPRENIMVPFSTRRAPAIRRAVFEELPNGEYAILLIPSEPIDIDTVTPERLSVSTTGEDQAPAVLDVRPSGENGGIRVVIDVPLGDSAPATLHFAEGIRSFSDAPLVQSEVAVPFSL